MGELITKILSPSTKAYNVHTVSSLPVKSNDSLPVGLVFNSNSLICDKQLWDAQVRSNNPDKLNKNSKNTGRVHSTVQVQ